MFGSCWSLNGVQRRDVFFLVTHPLEIVLVRVKYLFRQSQQSCANSPILGLENRGYSLRLVDPLMRDSLMCVRAKRITRFECVCVTRDLRRFQDCAPKLGAFSIVVVRKLEFANDDMSFRKMGPKSATKKTQHQ